jgi:beta-galactosidase
MLIAVGLINNVVVARDTVHALRNATTIRLVADPPELEANGQDILLIEAYIIDANGTWLHAARNSVRFSLNGSAAELVGDNPINAQAGACITLEKAMANITGKQLVGASRRDTAARHCRRVYG